MKVHVVILGAGVCTRMGGSIPKQFIDLSSRPVIAHTLEAFSTHDGIGYILVVTHPEYIEKIKEFIEQYNISIIIDIIQGGRERRIIMLTTYKIPDGKRNHR